MSGCPPSLWFCTMARHRRVGRVRGLNYAHGLRRANVQVAKAVHTAGKNYQVSPGGISCSSLIPQGFLMYAPRFNSC